MKRRKLEPLPLPPEGYMFSPFKSKNGSIVLIEDVEEVIFWKINYSTLPHFSEDPTYNMRSSKYGKIKHK